MDLGVGSLCSRKTLYLLAIQLIKDPTYLTSPVVSKFTRVTLKSLPIISLGLIRVILVKGTDYPVIYVVWVSFLFSYLLNHCF